MRRPLPILALLAAGLAAPAVAQDDYSHRMHQEHQHETPAASGATEGEPRVPVVTEEVVYATFDGVAVKGYLARGYVARQRIGPSGLTGRLYAVSTGRLAAKPFLADFVRIMRETSLVNLGGVSLL